MPPVALEVVVAMGWWWNVEWPAVDGSGFAVAGEVNAGVVPPVVHGDLRRLPGRMAASRIASASGGIPARAFDSAEVDRLVAPSERDPASSKESLSVSLTSVRL